MKNATLLTPDRLEALKEQYHHVLLRHVLDPAEDNLVEAASIGRRLIIHGIPTEEAVAVHEEALIRVASLHPELGLAEVAGVVSQPLMEMLMAYGLNFRRQLDSSMSLNRSLRKEVDERKKVERELKSKGEELERSNADLEKFAYVVSHDLQAPLRQIGSFSDLLERHCGPVLEGDGEDFLGFITRGVTRMQELIRALLQYSRVGRSQLGYQEVDTNQVAKQVADVLSPELESAGAELTIEALPGVPADPRLLGLVFQNLVQNGLKFIKEGQPMIRVTGRTAGACAHFSVRDNGIGIESRYHEEVFQVFRRLHAASEFEGTGIGLAICRKIIERHGGRMWVESKLGSGADFRFTIPLTPAAPAEAAESGRE